MALKDTASHKIGRPSRRIQNGGGVPMFLSTPWGVDVSGFRLAVVGTLRPAGGVRRPFPCGPVQAARAGSW